MRTAEEWELFLVAKEYTATNIEVIKAIMKEAYNKAINDASIKCDNKLLSYTDSKIIKQAILRLKK